ncbi:MAG: hypothetical protein ACP5NX_04270 [Candidatus Bilamarchaeaceae archaeon]
MALITKRTKPAIRDVPGFQGNTPLVSAMPVDETIRARRYVAGPACDYKKALELFNGREEHLVPFISALLDKDEGLSTNVAAFRFLDTCQLEGKAKVAPFIQGLIELKDRLSAEAKDRIGRCCGIPEVNNIIALLGHASANEDISAALPVLFGYIEPKKETGGRILFCGYAQSALEALAMIAKTHDISPAMLHLVMNAELNGSQADAEKAIGSALKNKNEAMRDAAHAELKRIADGTVTYPEATEIEKDMIRQRAGEILKATSSRAD